MTTMTHRYGQTGKTDRQTARRAGVGRCGQGITHERMCCFCARMSLFAGLQPWQCRTSGTVVFVPVRSSTITCLGSAGQPTVPRPHTVGFGVSESDTVGRGLGSNTRSLTPRPSSRRVATSWPRLMCVFPNRKLRYNVEEPVAVVQMPPGREELRPKQAPVR